MGDDGGLLSAARDELLRLASILLTPWSAYQAGIIALCLLVALGVARLATPPLEARLRALQVRPAVLRALVIPLRRLHWIVWALLLWAVSAVMLGITWPSRSYLIVLAARLVGAWVAIAIASRMIRNRNLSRLAALIAWPVAAMAILGVLEDAGWALDSIALTIGETRISALLVLKGLALIVLLLWAAAIASNFIERRLRQGHDLTPTSQVLIAKLARALLMTLAVVLTLTAVGVDLTALAVFSGALGLGIGFGLQKVASNLISGVIILLDRSIKPGDVISLGGTFGWVTELQSRYVSLVTRDGVEHLIPNETFVSETVINWSHSSRQVRIEITFGTSYGDDPHKTREIAVEAVSTAPRVLAAPKSVCHVAGFGDSSIDFVLRFWIVDPENGVANVSGLAYLAIWDAFKEHGVTIPFPHRQLLLSEPVRVETAPPRRSRRSAGD